MHGHPTSETFDENARPALGDEHLRAAPRRATLLFGERRIELVLAIGVHGPQESCT